MTPKQSKMLWIAVVPCLLLTAVILWFGAQLLREGIYQVVGVPTQQDKGHNAYETLAVRQCEKQAQASGQKSEPGAKACGYTEPNEKNGALGLVLLWGAISIAIVSTIVQGFRWLRRFLQGR